MIIKRLRNLYEILDTKTRRRIPVAFVLMIISNLIEIAGMAMAFPLVHVMVEQESFRETPYLLFLYNLLNVSSVEQFILVLIFLVFGLIILRNVAMVLIVRWQTRFIVTAELLVSEKLLRKYIHAPYEFFLIRTVSELVTNVIGTSSAAFRGFITPSMTIASEVFTVSAILFGLAAINPIILLIGLISFTGVSAAFYYWARDRVTKLGSRYIELSRETNASIYQIFGALKEVRVLGRASGLTDRFTHFNRELGKLNVRRTFFDQLPRTYLEIIFSLAAMAIATTVVLSVPSSQALAFFGLMALVLIRLLPSLGRILTSLQTLRMNGPAAEIVYRDITGKAEYLEDDAAHSLGNIFKPSEGKDVPPPPLPKPATPDMPLVRLEDVSYTYPRTNQTILDHISLDIHAGESIGIVGASGAGKSTLADIILGFLKPQQGQILINGHPLEDIMPSWHAKVGFVPQGPFLMRDTIAANIALGLPRESIDLAAAKRALHLAQAEDFVNSLPEKEQTVLSDGGENISGGQAQRVAVARALYRDPDVLILDEVTSALDAEMEYRLSNMIEAVSGDKTVIIIAHRLSTIQNCDKVLYMENGKIIGFAGFIELQDMCPGFKRMVQLASLNRGRIQ
ncbi:ABC transporter ATP-binding protein [Thalassospiraceae bacterium LMO-JJ14]|nr:ABC transporter ATP-binding protein [Thalassospiraceae bacterium LMO-JJ14]